MHLIYLPKWIYLLGADASNLACFSFDSTTLLHPRSCCSQVEKAAILVLAIAPASSKTPCFEHRGPISHMSAQAAQRGRFPLHSCGSADLNRRFQLVGIVAVARFALARSAAPQEIEQYAPLPFAAAGFRFSNFMHFLPLAHAL